MSLEDDDGALLLEADLDPVGLRRAEDVPRAGGRWGHRTVGGGGVFVTPSRGTGLGRT